MLDHLDVYSFQRPGKPSAEQGVNHEVVSAPGLGYLFPRWNAFALSEAQKGWRRIGTCYETRQALNRLEIKPGVSAGLFEAAKEDHVGMNTSARQTSCQGSAVTPIVAATTENQGALAGNFLIEVCGDAFQDSSRCGLH
jgi:hypothetical protein